MPSPTSNPLLILASPLTPSSSVLSFISPPRLCEATWLTSISLSLESASWAPVCTGMLKLNVFPFFFISFFSLSPLGFENSCLEHCFPTKQVASYSSHVGHDWIECLVHWVKEKRKGNQLIFFLLLSRALLFFSKISTKISSQLFPVFSITIRTIHLVNTVLCPCCPMISEMQLTSAPLQHLTKDSNQRQGEPVWWCFSLTNNSLKQEALPLCRDPQSSSNHQWWLWCSIQLMAHCCYSLFTSTWAGWHSYLFPLCYQNKCVTLFRGLTWRSGMSRETVFKRAVKWTEMPSLNKMGVSAKCERTKF